MAGPNPIRRRHSAWGYARGKARSIRGWAATCQLCGEEVRGFYSRKQAKDALHYHAMTKCKPGLAGR